MRWALLSASLCLLACTAPNPSYTGDTGGSGSGGAGGGVGGGGSTPDLASAPKDLGTPADLSPAECNAGQRRCAMNPIASQGCEAGHYATSRECPQGDVGLLDAQCTSGYCVPPISAPCDVQGGPSEDFCFNQVSKQTSCQPFVDPQSKSVSWSCAQIAGSGASGDACTTGSQCRSGFCGSNGTCFRPCNGGGNCPQHNPQLSCKKVTISVEGVSVNATSCVP